MTSHNREPGFLDRGAGEPMPVPGELQIRRQDDGNTLVLSVRGELDLASAPTLERALHEAELNRVARVVIDLSELAFMDSSGIVVLLRAQQNAYTRAHRLVLRRGPDQVQRLFEMTGLLDDFTFAD